MSRLCLICVTTRSLAFLFSDKAFVSPLQLSAVASYLGCRPIVPHVLAALADAGLVLSLSSFVARLDTMCHAANATMRLWGYLTQPGDRDISLGCSLQNNPLCRFIVLTWGEWTQPNHQFVEKSLPHRSEVSTDTDRIWIAACEPLDTTLIVHAEKNAIYRLNLLLLSQS